MHARNVSRPRASHMAKGLTGSYIHEPSDTWHTLESASRAKLFIHIQKFMTRFNGYVTVAMQHLASFSISLLGSKIKKIHEIIRNLFYMYLFNIYIQIMPFPIIMHVRNVKPGFPQGLENREKNNGQGKVREFYFGPKVREKSGNFVSKCWLPWKLFLSIIEKVCHQYHEYESAQSCEFSWNLFCIISGVTSTALN